MLAKAVEREVLPGIHCHGANVDGNAARQAQDFRWDVDPEERLLAVRHPGGNDPRHSEPRQQECRIRDQNDVQKNTSDECSWGSGAVPLQRDGEDNECVDELLPVTFPSDVSVRDASVSAMNAPTPGTATTVLTLEEKPEMFDL